MIRGFLFLTVALMVSLCRAREVVIRTPEEFVDFSRSVNSGTDYYGKTVILDADIDFAGYEGEVRPVGDTRTGYFRGIFNGQGHNFQNLIINTSARYAGLFGYSRGAIIKNFLFDETCKVISSYTATSDAFIGGLIGKCYTINDACVFEDAVNKAAIVFAGNVTSDVDIGGIVGGCEYSSYPCTVRNNVNFGEIVDNGETSWFSKMGGIIGHCEGSDAKRCKIHNNLNYGTVTHRGTSRDVFMGGIIGNMYSTTSVQNCVSVGQVVNEKAGRYNHVGAVAGYAFSEASSVVKSFWLPSVGISVGIGYNRTEVDVSETELTEPNMKMIDTLNKNSVPHGWAKWALNMNHSVFILKINGNIIFYTDIQIIQIPNFISNAGFTYSGLFLDENLTVPLNSYEVTHDVVLYSTWTPKFYSVTFVYNATYNESVVLPFMGGITLPELPPVEGYVLNWCSADNSTCNPDEMLTQNLTLYPIWTIPKLSSSSFNPPEDSGSIGSVSRYVKITFDIENIWTSEVEAVIKEHGGECKHKIVSIDDLGSTTDVTIMFDEVEDAESFLSSIVASRKHAFEQDRIIKIVYVDESLFSGGCIVKPFTFLLFFSSIFLSTFIIIII